MKIHDLVLGIFFLLIIVGDIRAASFDCGKAASEVERIICNDDELSRLDESLNNAYLEVLKRTDNKQQMIESQKQWLKYERNGCRDAECIKIAYETRIKELGLSSSDGIVFLKPPNRSASSSKAQAKVVKSQAPEPPDRTVQTKTEQQRESTPNQLRKSEAEPEVNERLFRAAEDGSLEQTIALLARGGEVNARGSYGQTVLMAAAQSGNLDLVRFLIDKGAGINAKNAIGETVLMAGVRWGNIQIVRLLIDKGANISAKDNDDQTVLIHGIKSGNLEIVRFLVDKGVDVSARDGNGRPVLMTAAERGNLEIVSLLVDRGTDVNAATKGGTTALMAAAWMGYLEVGKFLIDKGAEVNAKGKTGQTVLMYGAAGGNLEIVRLLIDKGAEINAKNQQGETALSLVPEKEDRHDIVHYLKTHGAKSLESRIVAEKRGEKDATKCDAASSGKSQVSFCREVSQMIKDETIDKYMPEWEAPIARDPRGLEYLNLDIDGDGIADKVTVSSGSESSYLVVQLSSGGEYDLDESGFIKIRKIKEQIYALVTYWEWHRQPDGSREGKIVGNRLYKLTKHEAERICDTEDFERR